MAKQTQVAGATPNQPAFHPFARGTHNQQTVDGIALAAILKIVADGSQFDLKQASDLARAAVLQDPDLEGKLIKFAKHGKTSADEVIRILRIFECICPKPKLLDHLLSLEGLDHPRVRSKVVLTIGRLFQNADWLREQLQDPNARVRANAVEALWEVQVTEAEELLLKAAVDSNNRVIGNAAYGLYKLGNSKSVSILHSLLRHPDKLFRRTGLWMITQLGDSRFLECLAAPPADYLEDEKEIVLRENAHQRLTASLQASRFAGKLMLNLFSFKAAHQMRIARFCCSSSELGAWLGSSELSGLNFVVEEGGKQVEEFNYRWIQSSEKMFSVVIVPAGLDLRGPSLRALAEQAASDEAVSILRYLPSSPCALKDNRNWLPENQVIGLANAFRSQGCPISPNWQEAALKGLEKLAGASGPRHLFLAADRSIDGKLPTSIQKLARASNIAVHALVSEDAYPELSQALHTLSIKSGGTFLQSDSAHALPAMVKSVQARQADSCELSWTGFGKNPADIRIQCISGCGYGELPITGQKS